MNNREKAAEFFARYRPDIQVRRTPFPLVPTTVESGQTIDVLTDLAWTDARPLALILHDPPSDLWIVQVKMSNDSIMRLERGKLPAAMFSQFIPEGSRVALDLPTVQVAQKLVVTVENRGPKVALVSGYFDCVMQR